ncbi:MAG: sigma-70 family RNA polymerase sigma factor [Oscillospiraceae bacterium]
MDNEKMVEAVIKAQSGDKNSFAELFMGYKDSTYYVAKKMFMDDNKALNIVYETVISVFRQIKTLNPASAFPLWVNMLSGSICKRRMTKEEQAMLSVTSGDASLLGTIEDARAQISREAFDNNETKSMICSIADTLPSDQKLCALMYYFCGLKVEYIAQALGSNPVVIKNRIFSATNKIKEGMYGFENKGEKLYAVPAWLIAASFAAQSKGVGINSATVQQIFGSASQTVFGVSSGSPALSEQQAQAPVTHAAPHAAQAPVHQEKASVEDLFSDENEIPVSPVHSEAYESVSFDKIKERDYDRFENSDDDDADDYKKKKKKAGSEKAAAKTKDKSEKGFFRRPLGIILIVIIVLAVLAAAAIFVLPKVTNGSIDPLSMVTSLFSNPEKQMEKVDTLMAASDYEGAVKILQKLVEKDQTNATIYAKMITCYEALGDNAKVIEAFKNYYSLVPRQDDIELYKHYISIAQNEPVTWVDTALGNLVCQALGKESVTPADLANVSELILYGDSKLYVDAATLSADMGTAITNRTDEMEKVIGYTFNGEEKGIATYSTFIDLLNFSSLKSLSFNFVQYGDLETALRNNPGISSLSFVGCELAAIPDFTMLTALNSLSITNDSISDVSPVATMAQLTSLDLSNNAITDISSLSGMTALTSLNLSGNKIADVTALKELKTLTALNLTRNEIKDKDLKVLSDLKFEKDQLKTDEQFFKPKKTETAATE